MKRKMMKKLIALTAMVGLVAVGCAHRSNQGGTDNQYNSSYGNAPANTSGTMDKNQTTSPGTGETGTAPNSGTGTTPSGTSGTSGTTGGTSGTPGSSGAGSTPGGTDNGAGSSSSTDTNAPSQSSPSDSTGQSK